MNQSITCATRLTQDASSGFEPTVRNSAITSYDGILRDDVAVVGCRWLPLVVVGVVIVAVVVFVVVVVMVVNIRCCRVLR